LEAIVVGHLTVARIAEALGVSWNTANGAVLAEGQRVLIDDPHRYDDVTVVGFDEHVWRHMATHPPRRQVRHRDHRPHPDPHRHRPRPAAGHDRGPFQAGREAVAGCAA
jgi:hypothetical protein